MRNLRTQYGKELGKVKASKPSGSGTNDIYMPTWRCFELLHFLRDSITPFKTRPTPGIAVIQGEPELIKDTEISTDSEGEENKGFLYNPTAFETMKSAKSVAKIKESFENKLLQKSLSVLEDVSNKKKRPIEEDGDVIFGKHVCQSLKDIKDKRSKELVKLKIQHLLFEAQYGDICNSQQEAANNNYPWGNPY